MSAIEWTDATWNPTIGCSRVSAGCENCYAEKMAHRLSYIREEYDGLTTPQVCRCKNPGNLEMDGSCSECGLSFGRGPRWNGEVKLLPERLDQPLHWRKPRRVFVDSMSDVFHEKVPDEYIDRVFAVMQATPDHTYQILTKRPEPMCEYIKHAEERVEAAGDALAAENGWCHAQQDRDWPLSNVWLGTSVEDQAAADERIPHLLQTPAAVRFLSCEPLLGAVDLRLWLKATTRRHLRADVQGMLKNRAFDYLQHDDGRPMTRAEAKAELRALLDRGVEYIPVSSDCLEFDQREGCPGHRFPRLDWVIVGGESGPGARPCDIEWIRAIVGQCRDAKVPVFVKQFGAKPVNGAMSATFGPEGKVHYTQPKGHPREAEHRSAIKRGKAKGYSIGPMPLRLRSRKGADPAEWPEDLRVREMP